MTNSLTSLLLPALVGVAGGLFFFGGLWWTVQQLPRVRTPAVYALLSFFVRTAGVLLAFYLVADGRWERVLVAVVAFVVTRFFVVRVVRTAPGPARRESEQTWN